MTKSKKRSTITKVISSPSSNIQYEILEAVNVEGLKKRVPKPRRKNVSSIISTVSHSIPLTNIIVHLKCSLSDLRQFNDEISNSLTDPLAYDPTVPPEIRTYHRHTSINDPYSLFEEGQKPYEDIAYRENHGNAVSDIDIEMKDNVDEFNNDALEKFVDVNEMERKLKKLKVNLYKNTLGDKRSACFWCTYDFDNSPCCIPKYEMEEQIYGYGSFCRPECAAAYLMKENIDDSMKFERYHLLNRIYGKVFDYSTPIRPAPNPYYLLDKYLGNLSIQEYRSLLKSEHLLLVLEKPLTRVLPELHDDNDDHGETKTQKQGMYGMYKVRRASDNQTKPSKSGLLMKHFG